MFFVNLSQAYRKLIVSFSQAFRKLIVNLSQAYRISILGRAKIGRDGRTLGFTVN